MSKPPQNWSIKPIKDLCNIHYGKSPSDVRIEYSSYLIWGTGGVLGYASQKLFDGPITLLGRKGTISKPIWIESDSWVTDTAYAVTSKQGVNEKFLYYLLDISDLKELNESTGVPSLNRDTVYNFKVTTSDNIEEQNKIAKILTSVDKVIELTEIEIEKLKNLKKGLMQDVLTKGIGHTKFKDSPIGKIPESWISSTFKANCTVRQGLQVAISERFKKDGPNRYPYITVKFIRNYSNPEYIENPATTVICSSNDILMTRTGNTGQIVTNAKGVFHNNFFLIDFDKEKICKDYLFYYLNSSFMQIKIKIAAGVTTIPDLNHGDFYSLPLILPAYEEQEKISLIIKKVDENLNLKSKKLKKLKNIKRSLMQDLLTGKVRVKI